MRSIIALAAIFFIIGSLPAAAISPGGDRSEYKLQPLDVITITVHGQPDLTTKTRITSEGQVTFPLIGKISLGGLSVQEAEHKIRGLLEKDYLVTAQVLVFIDDYHPRQVSVIGEVKNPGKYDMPGEKGLTLMQAVAMAGGFTKHADMAKTRVMRIEKGEKKSIIVNAKDITEKGAQDKDVALEPDDIVFVPESFF